MHSPEAFILRRCYPVPVTFKDLRTAHAVRSDLYGCRPVCRCDLALQGWHAALKEATGAIDEVYAVIDGREVRVAVVRQDGVAADCSVTAFGWGHDFHDLLAAADRAGYWARPHEVRLDLQERPISRETVAQAVLAGQQYLERSGDGGAA